MTENASLKIGSFRRDIRSEPFVKISQGVHTLVATSRFIAIRVQFPSRVICRCITDVYREGFAVYLEQLRFASYILKHIRLPDVNAMARDLNSRKERRK